MTQKEKKQNIHRRRYTHVHRTHAMCVSHSIHLHSPDTRNSARLYNFTIATLPLPPPLLSSLSTSARKPLFIVRPFVSVSIFFFALLCQWHSAYRHSQGRVQCVCVVLFPIACHERTMMMTLVYEITIDLSTYNYIKLLFSFPSSRLPAIHLPKI